MSVFASLSDAFATLVGIGVNFLWGLFIRLLLSAPIPIVDPIISALSPFPERKTPEPLLLPTQPVPAPDWVKRDHPGEDEEPEFDEEGVVAETLYDRIWRWLIWLLIGLVVAAYVTHLGEAASRGKGESSILIIAGVVFFLFGIGRGVLIWLGYF